jgi:hypothetical protein
VGVGRCRFVDRALPRLTDRESTSRRVEGKRKRERERDPRRSAIPPSLSLTAPPHRRSPCERDHAVPGSRLQLRRRQDLGEDRVSDVSSARAPSFPFLSLAGLFSSSFHSFLGASDPRDWIGLVPE